MEEHPEIFFSNLPFNYFINILETSVFGSYKYDTELSLTYYKA